jgi:hypothetical protein
MHLRNTVLFYSTLVSVAPRVLSNKNSINRLTPRTALLDKCLARMSDAQASAIAPTCHNGTIKWPSNDLPPPVEDAPFRQLSLYDIPATVPNTLIVHNYCDYDLHYTHRDSVKTLDTGILTAGATKQSPFTTEDAGVWLASKTPDMVKAVQAEYTVSKATDALWYNLSLIPCLGSKNGLPNADTTECAGHEAGLQFGNQQFQTFQCAPGMWCDDQAYFYQVDLTF